ncbi:hypothetical protein ABZP36_014328 [Zizania latifolia]
MLQCIFLLSDSGEVMVEKQMTAHRVDRAICGWFWEYVLAHAGGDASKVLQVVVSPTHYLFQVYRNGVTFLACTQVEMPPLMAIEFLSRVADVLIDYLGDLNEDIIKDNFVLVYQPNILKEMITPPNIVSKMLNVMTGKSSNLGNKLPDATASYVPWRTTVVKDASNEVYVNIVEELDACVNREGALVKCEAYGKIQVNSSLPGVPELTLTFPNPTIINDVMFHPCVRFRPWESNQIVSFVPPDGQFDLMSYRVKKLKTTPIYVKPQLTSDSGNCRVNVMVGIKNDPGKPINSITVQFRLPPLIASADLTANYGTVDILADQYFMKVTN